MFKLCAFLALFVLASAVQENNRPQRQILSGIGYGGLGYGGLGYGGIGLGAYGGLAGLGAYGPYGHNGLVDGRIGWGRGLGLGRGIGLGIGPHGIPLGIGNTHVIVETPEYQYNTQW